MNEWNAQAGRNSLWKQTRTKIRTFFFSQKTLSVKLETSVNFDELAKCKSPDILYFKYPKF